MTTYIRLAAGNQIAIGADLNLECNSDGYPMPNITWFKDGREIVQTHRIQVIDSNRLLIYGATKDDSGDYKCVGRNEFSMSEHTEQIIVEGMLANL